MNEPRDELFWEHEMRDETIGEALALPRDDGSARLAAALEREHVRHEAELDRTALGFLVVSRDDEFGSLYITGPWPTRAAAQKQADLDHAAINAGIGSEIGWTHTVERLMPGDESRTGWVVLFVRSWFELGKLFIPAWIRRPR